MANVEKGIALRPKESKTERYAPGANTILVCPVACQIQSQPLRGNMKYLIQLSRHLILPTAVSWFAIASSASSSYSTASGYTVTYTDLMPATHVSGIIWAGAGGQQAGGDGYAGIWSGTSGSFVDLSPAGYAGSLVQGTTGSQQAGTVYSATASYAACWSGTAASFVNLGPSGALYSHAWAAGGSQQAGDVTYQIDRFGNGLTHAAVWSGTAASFKDLHPVGAYQSYAYGTTGAHQAGSASFATSSYLDHAALWSGTAGSFVDLNPAGAERSIARAISGNQEAGYAIFGGYYHAGFWSGTAESFVDLNPVGSSGSFGMGTSGNAQAGDAYFDHYHALLWFGSSASFLDLESVLGPDYTRESHAMAIWTDGNTIQVGGYAINQAGYPAPILWTITPVPEPTVLALGIMGTAVSLPWLRRKTRASSAILHF